MEHPVRLEERGVQCLWVLTSNDEGRLLAFCWCNDVFSHCLASLKVYLWNLLILPKVFRVCIVGHWPTVFHVCVLKQCKKAELLWNALSARLVPGQASHFKYMQSSSSGLHAVVANTSKFFFNLELWIINLKFWLSMQPQTVCVSLAPATTQFDGRKVENIEKPRLMSWAFFHSA